jgi:uncharacterized membrane protein YphA (DoxX/SURF4 family)
MNILLITLQVIIALGIYNVWILRYNKKTKYRGGNAKNIKEEFAAYGFPFWFMVVIGSSKVALATLLIIGIWIPVLTQPAAGLLAVLMCGAVLMHIKVHDPLRKALPAIGMLLLSISVVLLG